MNTIQYPATSLVLGVDGGGTKTVAWLAVCGDDSRENKDVVLGRGSAGPSNQRAVGPVMALRNLETAIESAFTDAGLPRATVAAACLGLAGADRDSDRRVIEDWANFSRLAETVLVVNDAVPLLHVDQGNGWGVALIAGTGSLAWGCNAKGKTARSGGWGYLFSDEGSAFSIGRAVLNAVSRAVDGRGEQTCLVADVIGHLELSSPQEIVTAVYSHEVPRAVVANMASLGFSAAARRDNVALEILKQAAAELAAMAVVTARRLEMQSMLSLALTGSVLIQNPEFRQQVIAGIETAGITLFQTAVVKDAVVGAVNIASQRAGAASG